MEAPEHRARVRPLPPEGETGESDRAQSVRTLLPLVGGGLVLVAFIVIIALGSRPDTTDAGAPDAATTTPTFVRPPDPTTTTLAVPTTILTRDAPELGEVLPEFVGGMNAIVGREDGTVVIARWRLNRRFPQFTQLPDGPSSSALDASGRIAATFGLGTRGDNAQLLSVGPVTIGTRPVFVAASSFAWHSTTPGLLAVIGRQPADDVHGVFIMEFDSSGSPQFVRRIADAGPTWVVAGFHESGIAVVDHDLAQGVVRILEHDGSRRVSTLGSTHVTTDDYILGVEGTPAGGTATVWTWDLEPAEVSPRLLREGFDVPEIISPDGRHGAEIVRAQTSTVVVRSEEVAGPRSIGVLAPLSQAYFITNDHVAAFSSAESTLFIIEWRTGLTIEFELEGEVLYDIASPDYDAAQAASSFLEGPIESPPDDG